MNYYIVKLLLILSAMGLVLGCSSNTTLGDGKVGQYEVGTASRVYCQSSTPESRQALRVLAAAAGLPLVDYCATFGVPLTVLDAYQDAYELTEEPVAPDPTN